MTMQSTARTSRCSHAARYAAWKKIKEQEGSDAGKRSANLLSLPAHLAESRDSVQALAGCTYMEKKLVMPHSLFLQPEGLRYTHLLKAPLPFSGQVALLVYSSTGGSEEL